MGRYSGTSGVFNEGAFGGSIDISEEGIQKEFADVHGLEFPYEPTMEGAEAINAYMEEEYLDICQEQGFLELSYFERNRVEMPVNEAFGDGGFIDKAVQFFKKIGQKIKSLFDKFMVMLNRFIMSDKDFIKKYESKIKSASTSGFEFKGYNFTLEGSNGVDAAAGRIGGLSDSINSKSEDKSSENITSEIRAKALGQSGELSASEFSKELFKIFRGGEDSKVDVKVSTSDICEQVKSAKKDKEDALKAYKAIKTKLEATIRVIEGEKSKLQKQTGSEANGEHQRKDTRWIDAYKSQISVLQTYNGGYLSAIKARNRQNKSIAVKLITGSGKKDSKNESFEFDDSNFSFI